MARKKREPEPPKDLEVRRIPLREAIGHVINLQAMMNGMKLRRDSLSEQLNATHSDELRETLAVEQEALRRSVLQITTRLEDALNVFEKSKVTINGTKIGFLDVVRRIQRVKKQAMAFEEIYKGMSVDDMGVKRLKEASNHLKQSIKYCGELWLDELAALMIAVDATVVNEADVLDLDVSYDEIGFELEAEWNGTEWELIRSVELPHSSTNDYLHRITQTMADRTCEVGTRIHIKIIQGRKNIKISSDFVSKTKPIQRGWYVSGTDSTTTAWGQ